MEKYVFMILYIKTLNFKTLVFIEIIHSAQNAHKNPKLTFNYIIIILLLDE